MTTALTGPVTGPTTVPPAGAPAAPGIAHPRWSVAERLVLSAMGTILFVVYTGYAWARHAKYETTGFDLGIFDQVVRAYSRFSAPTSPLKGVDYNILGDHFHPILVLLAPLYWLWDDPRVLLTAQAALFALSIWPVGAFVRRRFGGRIGLFAALAYGVSWPLQGAVHFDFHEIAIGVLLVAILVNALDLRRDRLVAVVCLLLLLVREDMGALVVLVGLLVVLRRTHGPGDRRRSVLFGGGLGLVGVVGFWLATSVVIPALGPQGFTYWTFNALGPDPVSAVRFMLLHPWRVAAMMVTPAVKFHTLVAIFAPTALFALGSPYVLLTAPFLLQRMLNDRELLWQTNFHYTSIIAPVLIMAAADTVDRLIRRHPAALGPRPIRLPVGSPSGSPVGSPSCPMASHGGGRRVVVSLAVVWIAWCVILPTWSMWTRSALYPVSGGFLSGRVWDRDLRWRAVHETLPMIPADQCVEADNQLAPQLTSTNYVTRVTMSEGLATWAIIDMFQKETGWQTPPPALALDRLEHEGFEIVSWRGPIVLLHRDVPIDPVCHMTS